MLNEREMRVLAAFLRELMPVGANYQRMRFEEFIRFLCMQLEIDRDKLREYMRE